MMNNYNGDPIFSFAIVADSHLNKKENLSFESGDAYGSKLAAMYDDLVASVNAMNPAFVVHLGDITDPVPVSPDFADSAQIFHNASSIFDMPYYLVPGNHDIGEKIHPALPNINDKVSITKHAIEQYQQHFGEQRYSFEHEGCLFLVINTMLLNSVLEEEQEQWEWLEETLHDNSGKRVFVFAHYPLYLSARDEPDDGMALLILPNSCPAPGEFSNQLPDGVADRQGTLVGLIDGMEMATTLREAIAKRAGKEAPQSPALLLLND